MKCNKLLMTTMCLMAMGSALAFADATIVDSSATTGDDGNTTGTGSYNTYAGSATGVVAGSTKLTSTTWSAASHSIDLYADVAEEALVPSLYYNENNVNADAALYDEDWDLNTGFTTKDFAIGLTGTTLSSKTLQVTVAATPFALYDSDGTTVKDTAGTMTVAVADSIGTEVDDATSQPSTVDNDPTSFTIQSDALTNDTVYESTTKQIAFTLTTAAHSDTLLAGRYKSTVTLTYKMV